MCILGKSFKFMPPAIDLMSEEVAGVVVMHELAHGVQYAAGPIGTGFDVEVYAPTDPRNPIDAHTDEKVMNWGFVQRNPSAVLLATRRT